MNGCNRNMDSILIALIPEIEDAADDAAFNASLMKMFAFAGPMPTATADPPILADSQKINLNLGWHGDVALNASLRALLDSIRINYRPQATCYYYSSSGNPRYKLDERNYSPDTAIREPYRLLTLFRAWNIYNYFSPYKYLLDRSWDSVLTDMIPLVIAAESPRDFHLALLQFQSKQQDAHANANSDTLTAHFGDKYLPIVFSLVEGKTIVTKVYQGVTGVKVGDEVTKVDGTATETIRDSLRRYTRGGNEPVIQRNLSFALLRGVELASTLVLTDGTGSRTVNVNRTSDELEMVDSTRHASPDGLSYKRLNADVGYVNFGILLQSDVGGINSDLWDTKALIIDCRNYPKSSAYPLCNILQSESSPFAVLSFPNPSYPGTLTYGTYFCGPSSNTNPYKGKVILLVNEISQSATEFAVMALSTTPNSITIGSQTAGADGNVMPVTYPTNIKMYFSGLGVQYPDGTHAQRLGVKLDHIVTPTIAGIRAGRDEVLEAALAIVAASSVNSTAVSTEIEISPNPTNGIITVHNAPENTLQISILNILGESVLDLANPYSIQFSLDLSAQPNGVYTVRCHTAIGIVSKQIIVNH